MPILMQGDSNMILFPMAYSKETIDRRFENLETLELQDFHASLLWDSSALVACIVKCEANDQDRYDVIASLEMQATEWRGDAALAVEKYWQQELAQVQGVVVDPKLRDFGLATYMYTSLIIKKGLVLVSDNEQYAGGKALWKHIARTSSELTVYVFDSVTGGFYPFDCTDRTVYNGSNIDDSIIWSDSPNREKYDIVMIAEQK